MMILKIIFFPITIPCWLIKRAYLKRFFTKSTISKFDAITGNQWEDVCRLMLQYVGYKAYVTANTNDFGADVIAEKKIKIAVQCKLYYNHNVSGKSVQEVTSGMAYYTCDLAIVMTNSKYTKSAKEIAEVQNVILIDRQDIIAFLSDVHEGTKSSKLFNLYAEYKRMKGLRMKSIFDR